MIALLRMTTSYFTKGIRNFKFCATAFDSARADTLLLTLSHQLLFVPQNSLDSVIHASCYRCIHAIS